LVWQKEFADANGNKEELWQNIRQMAGLDKDD